MSDYELAYLFTEHIALSLGVFGNFVTLLFAFLVASALAAPRLSRSLAIVSLFMFTFFSMCAVIQIYAATSDIVWLGELIRVAATVEGSDLRAHAMNDFPAFLLTGMPIGFPLTIVFVYVGAVYFFFLCRRGEFRLTA